jgi:serine/threonine-protein kinase RsbW
MTDGPITTSPSLELKVLSHPANLAAVRKAIESFAAGHGFNEKAVAEIGLVVNEAIANIIRHAYGNHYARPIHLTARYDNAGELLTIALRDWGNGIDPSTLPRREYDPLEPGGVGLICLKQWMDGVTFTPQPDGMIATLVRRRNR